MENTDVSSYFNDVFFPKKHYKTYEDLEHDIKKFQALSGTVLRIKNSSSVEYENKRKNIQIPDCIKYFTITYSCVHYGEHQSKGKGVRPNRGYLACGCEFLISAKYSDKFNGLFISKKNLVHNHKLNVKTAHLYARNRCLNSQQLQEVGDVLRMNPSNKELQTFLHNKFGKAVTLRDCVNLKARIKASPCQAIDITRFENSRVMVTSEQANDNTRSLNSRLYASLGQAIEDAIRLQNSRMKMSPDHVAEDVTRFQNSRVKMSPDHVAEDITRFQNSRVKMSLDHAVEDVTRFQNSRVKMSPDHAAEDVTRFRIFSTKAALDQGTEDATRSLNNKMQAYTDHAVEEFTRFRKCSMEVSSDHAVECSTRFLNYSVKVSPDQTDEDDTKSLDSRVQPSSDQAIDVTRPPNCSVKVSPDLEDEDESIFLNSRVKVSLDQAIEDFTGSMDSRVKASPDQVIGDVTKFLNSRVKGSLNEVNEDITLEFTDVSNYFNDIFQAKTHFKTYEELEQDLEKFQAISGTVLRIKNSSSVEYESRRRNLPVPVCIKYFSVTYSCVRFGEHHSKSRGIRPNRRYLACGCEFLISAKYSEKLNGLFITKKKLVHNHKLNVRTAQQYAKNRCLNSQQLQEVGDVLQMNPSNKELQTFLRKKFGKSLTLRDCVNLKAKVKASLSQAINIISQNNRELVTSEQVITGDSRSLKSRAIAPAGQAIEGETRSVSNKVKVSPDQAVDDITRSLKSEMDFQLPCRNVCDSPQTDLPLSEMVIVNHKICVPDITTKQANIQQNCYLRTRNLTDRLNFIMTSSELVTLQRRMKLVAALIEAWERDVEVSLLVPNDGNVAVVRQPIQLHQEPIEFDATSESVIAEPTQPSQSSRDNALPDAYFPLVMLTEETEACGCDDMDGNDMDKSRGKVQENEKVLNRYTHMEVLRCLNPKLQTIKRQGRLRKKRSLSRFTKWHRSHKIEREED